MTSSSPAHATTARDRRGRIVVGVDATPVSRLALERALREGQSAGLPVHVLSTWQPPAWVGDLSGLASALLPCGEDADHLADAVARDALRQASLAVPVDGRSAVTTEGRQGEPGRALADAARGAALVVVGGHGHGVVTGALLGSCTAYVLHHADCPVMVVPESAAPATGAAYARVVAGVDGSAASEAALSWALDAARRHRAPLLAVRSSDDPRDLAHLQRSVRDAGADPDGPEVTCRLVSTDPSEALLEAAGPADLLVVGSRGRGGLSGMLLGSVSARCTRRARGVVVVHRQRP